MGIVGCECRDHGCEDFASTRGIKPLLSGSDQCVVYLSRRSNKLHERSNMKLYGRSALSDLAIYLPNEAPEFITYSVCKANVWKLFKDRNRRSVHQVQRSLIVGFLEVVFSRETGLKHLSIGSWCSRRTYTAGALTGESLDRLCGRPGTCLGGGWSFARTI